MDFPLWHLVIVFLAGVIGEGYATVVGSGGILIQFVLLSLGLPLPVVVATDIAGSTGANLGIIAASKRTIWDNRKLLVLLTVPILVGGIIGTLFLIQIPELLLKYIIIFALVGLLVYMIFGKKRELQAVETLEIEKKKYPFLFGILMALGLYGNVSGVGVGTFQKLSFVSVLRISFADSLGVGTISSLPAQIFSIVITALAGLIAWPYMIALFLGSFVGANFVTRYVRRVPDRYLRGLLVVLAMIYLAYLLFSVLS